MTALVGIGAGITWAAIAGLLIASHPDRLFAILLPHRGHTGLRGTIEFHLFRRSERYQRFYWRKVWGRS